MHDKGGRDHGGGNLAAIVAVTHEGTDQSGRSDGLRREKEPWRTDERSEMLYKKKLQVENSRT